MALRWTGSRRALDEHHAALNAIPQQKKKPKERAQKSARRKIDHFHFGEPSYTEEKFCPKCRAVEGSARAEKITAENLLDLAGRCVRCDELAVKRFDGLCAHCYSNV